MANWQTRVMTQVGQNLLARSQAEETPLVFTNVKLSSHNYTGVSVAGLSDIEDVKMTVPVTEKLVVDNTTVKLGANCTNIGLTASFNFYTYGMYAHIGSEADVLFSICTNNDGDEVPAGGDVLWQTVLNTNVKVDNTDDITINIDPAASATKEYVDNLIAGRVPTSRTINGKSLTENITLNGSEINPTYTVASAVSGLVSGEAITTAFSKIAKAIADYITHKESAITTSYSVHGITLTTAMNSSSTDKQVVTAKTLYTTIASKIGTFLTGANGVKKIQYCDSESVVPATKTAGTVYIIKEG